MTRPRVCVRRACSWTVMASVRTSVPVSSMASIWPRGRSIIRQTATNGEYRVGIHALRGVAGMK